MKLATVKKIWADLNALNFGGVLEMPVIKFTRSHRHYGFYDHATMQFNLSDTKGFDKVRELVYHEMVHQYEHEFMGRPSPEDDHGKEFKKTYNKFAHGINKDKEYDYDARRKN